MTATMAMASRAPGRVVLRTAGVLTQLLAAACLLLGTISFVLVQQNNSGGSELAIAWSVGALLAIVFGGFMVRGGLVSLLVCAALDLTFGVVLLVVDYTAVRGVFRVLPDSDVEVLASGLTGAGIGCCGVALLCLAAIPQALRYGRWLHEASGTYPQVVEQKLPPDATARGWSAPPKTGSMWIMPVAPPAEQRSRRRMYIALAGFSIGFGAGIGVLVSASESSSSSGSPAAKRGGSAELAAAGSAPAVDAGTAPPAVPTLEVGTLLAAQTEALENGDIKGLAAMLAPQAFGFGAESDEVAEGRDAIEAQLARDLGELATGGVKVTAKSTHIGEEANHAWIAQELELSGNGVTKRFAITQLASAVDGKWVIAAWHWGVLVPDAVAEEKKLLGTLPPPKTVPNETTGPEELGKAVRAAFASRTAFADARSERADGFNFGSGPGERSIGGRGIKRVFQKLRAQIRVHDGIRIVSADAWDPTQKAEPTVAFAALNVDFTAKSRALTDLTQTFRVLAVFVKEAGVWKIVQTQWSHGGPIR